MCTAKLYCCSEKANVVFAAAIVVIVVAVAVKIVSSVSYTCTFAVGIIQFTVEKRIFSDHFFPFFCTNSENPKVFPHMNSSTTSTKKIISNIKYVWSEWGKKGIEY